MSENPSSLPPSRDAKNPEIERLRAVAILLVMLSHLHSLLSGWIHPALLEGWTGVALFFVISGFVVAKSLLRSLPDFQANQTLLDRTQSAAGAIRAFYYRRAFRILPLALLCSVVPLTIAVVTHKNFTTGTLSINGALKEFFAIVTFQYNYSYIHGNLPKALTNFWTLSVEEHFYLLLPLVLLFFPSRSQRFSAALGGAILVALVLRPLIPFSGPQEELWSWYRFASHNRFDSLFLGVALANYGLNEPRSSLRAPWVTQGFALALIGLLWITPAFFTNIDLNHGDTVFLSVTAVLSLGLVYLASLERGAVLDFRGIAPLLEYLGSRSYGIYLIHGPLIWVAESDWASHFPAWGRLALALAGTLALSELSFRLIEQPMIAFGKRWIAFSARDAAAGKNSQPKPEKLAA